MTKEDINIPSRISLLLDQVQSLQLATKNKNQEAESSYTPFLWQDNALYIFVSELATHTQNLRRDAQASAMIIEDEHQAKNVFARQRLILQCKAETIERTAQEWESLMAAFEARHGNTVKLLKTLQDFWLIRLPPQHGSFVQGFGQAFRFDKANFAEAEQVSGN